MGSVADWLLRRIQSRVEWPRSRGGAPWLRGVSPWLRGVGAVKKALGKCRTVFGEGFEEAGVFGIKHGDPKKSHSCEDKEPETEFEEERSHGDALEDKKQAHNL